MGRKRIYASNAERQRAYRERKRREKRNAGVTKSGHTHKVTSPPLRYFGGKWRLATWIIEHFPPHNVYVEPYAGGASVFFRKRPSPIEVINDLDEEVVNFFHCLREYENDLIRAIELTPYSRKEWERAYNVPADAGPVERARCFYIRVRQTYDPSAALSGLWPTWRRQINGARGKSITNEWSTLDHLRAAAARLKQAQLECREALQLIAQFDSDDTLFYVDPPYVSSTRGGSGAYRHEMTDDDHLALLNQLNNVRGMVILSGYDNELYNDRLHAWVRKTKAARTNANHSATEILWINQAATDRFYPLFAGL